MSRNGLRCVVFVFFFSVIFAKAYAYDDGDFQVWHTEEQEIKVNKRLKIKLEEEFRFGDDAEELYYQHYDIGLTYAFSQTLDLGLNYRQIYERKSGDFREENRPHINATVKLDLKEFKFEDRNRFQYRHFDYQDDLWQYRNKFTVKLPWKFTRLKINPYLADEVFINLDSNGFSRNRFYSGFGFNLTKNIKGAIYYLLQHSKSSGNWADANVLGTKLKISF